MIEAAYRRAATEPSDIVDHVPTLRWLASGCGLVREMGVRSGVSTVALLAGRPRGLISYDINPIPGTLAALAEDADVPFRFVQADTRHAEILPCDLLFIDTVHTYAQLSVELTLHADLARTIALHDTHIPEAQWDPRFNDPPGMWRAINELVSASPWRVVSDNPRCNGLTILSRP